MHNPQDQSIRESKNQRVLGTSQDRESEGGSENQRIGSQKKEPTGRKDEVQKRIRASPMQVTITCSHTNDDTDETEPRIDKNAESAALELCIIRYLITHSHTGTMILEISIDATTQIRNQPLHTDKQ